MKKSLLIAFIILFLLAAGGSSAAVYYYYQYNQLLLRANDPNIAVKALVSQIGKLVELPQGEQPTVATVTNPDLIKDQPFFAKAKKGDRVVLYPNARIAILFDESANKIINFGTINVSNAATPSGAAVSPTLAPAP